MYVAYMFDGNINEEVTNENLWPGLFSALLTVFLYIRFMNTLGHGQVMFVVERSSGIPGFDPLPRQTKYVKMRGSAALLSNQHKS